MNDRQRPDAGRRVYRPDDLVNGRFATRMSGPVARQIALALKGYRLSGAIRAVPQAGRSGPWAVTVSPRSRLRCAFKSPPTPRPPENQIQPATSCAGWLWLPGGLLRRGPPP